MYIVGPRDRRSKWIYFVIRNGRVPTILDYRAVRFYGWFWVVVFAMFGGMETAPRWSPVPAVILAVSLQNLLIYFLIARFAVWVRPDRRKSEDDGS